MSLFTNGEPTPLFELLSFCYPSDSQQNKLVLDQAALIKQLHTLPLTTQQTPLCEQLQRHLQAAETSQPQHYSQLRFIDALFDLYQKNTVFDEHVRDKMHLLLPLFAICQIQQPHWIWENNHPLLQVLALLQQHFIGWSNNQSKIGDRAITNLAKQLQTVHHYWLTDQRDNTIDKLASELNQAQQRNLKLEQRLKDVETGALRAQRSYQLTAKLLNEKMRGKQLPTVVSVFLQSHWRESLRLHLLRNSEQSPEWLRLKKLTDTFIWSFQPFDHTDKHQQQRIYQLIPQLQTELQSATISLAHRPQDLQEQLTLIENQHLHILKSEPISYQPFSLINDGDPLLAQATISSSLLKHVTDLNEGQWFLHQQHKQRIKLILKLNDIQQLLFVYHCGMKANQYSFEEFAYMLSSQQVLPLQQNEPLDHYANHLVKKLVQHRQQKTEKQQRRDNQEQQQRKHEAQHREQARLKALAEAEQLAAKKNQQKKQQQQAAQAAEKARRLAATTAQQQANDQQLNATQQQINNLNIGARIRFFNEFGDSKDCKLAVKLQTSGKYIFTDASGLKAKQCLQPELLNMLLDGSAKIIDAGIGFEDTLAKVVNGLRRK